jgi:Contractile injection system tube protein
VSAFARASLAARTDQSGHEIPVAARQWLPVDFNPETLKLSITNAMQANAKRRKKEPPQFVTDSTARLSVELVFDSTTYGNDVREITSLIAQMMKPKETARQQKKKGIPAIVIFEWGTFLFEGYIDSFNETLDFFAAEGVPLRSTVSLSITEQDDPFHAPGGVGSSDVGVLVPGDRSIDDLAQESGDPGAAGRIAAANGVENRRFPEIGAFVLPESDGRAPAAFSPAGGSIRVAAGDAFAGLNTLAPVAARPRIELSAQAPAALALSAGAAAGAGVRLGGSARASASASLSADVGASTSARIIFEES